MKTQFLFLIFWILIGIGLEAQPIHDLSQLGEGDSIEVEVVAHKERKECFDRDQYELTHEEQTEIYNYSLFLTEKKGDVFIFRLMLKRMRAKYSGQYKDPEALKYLGSYSFDSDFDSPLFALQDLRKYLHKPFTLSVSIANGNKRIVVDDILLREKGFSTCDGIESRKIAPHMKAVFSEKSHQLKNGTIKANLTYPIKKPQTIIIGKVLNPISKHFFISNSSDFYRHRLGPANQDIYLDDKGNFQTQLELNRQCMVYFSHMDSLGGEKGQMFPLFLAPGDSVQFTIDTQDPSKVIFEGKSAVKFETFREYSAQFLAYDVYFDHKLEPFSRFRISRFWRSELNRDYNNFVDESVLNSRKTYLEMLAFLDRERMKLGEDAFYGLKAELVYGYANLQLILNSIEDLELPDSLFYYTSAEKLFDLTLSNGRSAKMEYLLDSFGLRFEEVRNSFAYPKYLFRYLSTQIEPDAEKRNLMGKQFAKHINLAKYAYQGFALQTVMKEDILSWVEIYENNRLLNEAKSADEKLDSWYFNSQKDRIEEFERLCLHEPYLAEVNLLKNSFKPFIKGKKAPDMKLSDSENLYDFLGEKTALIFFEDWDNNLPNINELAIENPEVQFIFICFSPWKQVFMEIEENYQVEGLLFHVPGYGKNESRPYYTKHFQNQTFLINEQGLFESTFPAFPSPRLFEKELNELVNHQPNRIHDFWEAKKDIFYTVSFSFLSFLCLWGLYWYFVIKQGRIKELRQREQIETELRAIRSQMNPHFLFNSLSSVQNLINQSDKEKANHYLSRFSQLIRKVLNHSEQAMIPLEEELKVVDLYCELEALRFKFDYKIEVDSGIDAHTMEIPSMLIQPYVENSVRHGLATQGGAGFIGIFVRKMDGFIQITVEDNGIGIRKHMEEFAGHIEKSGFGLRLSDQRVLKINERYNMNIEVKIFDRRDDAEPSHGTRVVVRIPDEK